MPLLEIEIIGRPEGIERSSLAKRLADAAGSVFDSPPQATWVRIAILDSVDYAENGALASVPQPVFVKVTKRTHPKASDLADEIARLTAAIAEVCGRPAENVHVCYEPPAAGRQAFGGKIVPPDRQDEDPGTAAPQRNLN